MNPCWAVAVALGRAPKGLFDDDQQESKGIHSPGICND
jgi:hypothetical protein